MSTKSRYAVALLGAACISLATPLPSAMAQGPQGNQEISETFVLRSDHHLIIGNMDIQPGVGRSWTSKLNSVWGDTSQTENPSLEFSDAESITVTSRSPMILDRQHPEAW